MIFGLVVDPTPKMPIQVGTQHAAVKRQPSPAHVGHRASKPASRDGGNQRHIAIPPILGDDRTGEKPWWNKPEGTGRFELLTTALFMRGPAKVASLDGDW
jgi:hypothetical protein